MAPFSTERANVLIVLVLIRQTFGYNNLIEASEIWTSHTIISFLYQLTKPKAPDTLLRNYKHVPGLFTAARVGSIFSWRL